MAENMGTETRTRRTRAAAMLPGLPEDYAVRDRRQQRADAERIRRMQDAQQPKHRGKQEARPEQRKAKALGPRGRQKQRVDAVPHGKKTTHARGKLQLAKQGKRSHPVKGSPKAKRRIANRERQPHIVH
ncbi:MAG: hypothetical protein ACK4N5_22855 [Myxococcales bacterium]